MYESPRTIPRQCAFRSGSGPRRPHELVVWVDPSTIWAVVPSTISADFGPVRRPENRLSRVLSSESCGPRSTACWVGTGKTGLSRPVRKRSTARERSDRSCPSEPGRARGRGPRTRGVVAIWASIPRTCLSACRAIVRCRRAAFASSRHRFRCGPAAARRPASASSRAREATHPVRYRPGDSAVKKNASRTIVAIAMISLNVRSSRAALFDEAEDALAHRPATRKSNPRIMSSQRDHPVSASPSVLAGLPSSRSASRRPTV